MQYDIANLFGAAAAVAVGKIFPHARQSARMKSDSPGGKMSLD